MSTQNTNAWTRADLDGMTCAVEGCKGNHHHGPLFLSGRCHPKKPQNVEYRHGGVLVMHCHACGLHTINLRVDPEEQSVLDEHVVRWVCADPKCSDPPESHVAKLRPPCHRNAGVHVVYEHGAAHMLCGKCQDPVNLIRIKEKAADA